MRAHHLRDLAWRLLRGMKMAAHAHPMQNQLRALCSELAWLRYDGVSRRAVSQLFIVRFILVPCKSYIVLEKLRKDCRARSELAHSAHR